MGVVLVPSSGDDLCINWFNWRPTVALLVRGGVIPDGERRQRFENACGEGLSASEAQHAADYIESLIANLSPRDRIFSNGQATDKPIDYGVPISEWDEAETQNRYSAGYELLRDFVAFCRRSGGFEVL
jgi:hypothetical protein